MLDTNDRPGTLERYESATDTSDLTLRHHSRGAADVLTAAALADQHGATLLLRLQREWERAAPRRFDEAMVAAHAETLPKRHGKPDLKRARTEWLLTYRRVVRETAESLPTRESAQINLTAWAIRTGFPVDTVGPTLTWWLHPTCIVCQGHGRRKLPEAPVLGKMCFHCNGAGKTTKPLGAGPLLDHIGRILAKMQGGTNQLLR